MESVVGSGDAKEALAVIELLERIRDDSGAAAEEVRSKLVGTIPKTREVGAVSGIDDARANTLADAFSS